jgi:LacI family transcriptional regulator
MKPEFYRLGKEKEKSHKWLRDLNADGIIAHTWDTGFINNIIKLNLPAVICGLEKPKRSACRLFTDEAAVGQMAAEYFLERGFKQFAFCGFDDMIWSHQKRDGFVRTLAKFGFEAFIYQQSQVKQFLKPDKEQILIAKWLKSLPKPVALMACNDDRNIEVLAACKIAGLDIPDQVALLGVDDDELICNFCHPQLSSIALSTEQAGYQAACLLDKMIRGKKKIAEEEKNVIILPLHIATRQSTEIFAIEDPQVADAVKFIHNHSKEMIQVGDVAEAAGLSRRALEQRFRKELKHSVHEAIKYNRVNQMAEMLIGTNLSILQISRLLGYSHARNISRYFKQQKGISPLSYRKKFGQK